MDSDLDSDLDDLELDLDLDQMWREMYLEVEELADSEEEQQQGLTFQRIQQFKQFQADDLFVGDQCVICMEDIEIGRNMMRLDCDGQHTFCQVCIEGWFAIKKTCPICRHVF